MLAAEAHKTELCHYHGRGENNYHGGGENVENKSEPLAKVSLPPAAEAAGAPTIFDFSHLKETAENLDFEAPQRMKRDGSKEIHINDKINSSNQ